MFESLSEIHFQKHRVTDTVIKMRNKPNVTLHATVTLFKTVCGCGPLNKSKTVKIKKRQ